MVMSQMPQRIRMVNTTSSDNNKIVGVLTLPVGEFDWNVSENNISIDMAKIHKLAGPSITILSNDEFNKILFCIIGETREVNYEFSYKSADKEVLVFWPRLGTDNPNELPSLIVRLP